MLRILLVVPLNEEFTEVLKILRGLRHEVRDGEFLYTLDSQNRDITITGVVLGEAGPMPAAQRVERLIGLVNPTLIVVMGIAGSLSKDVKLGDVVVAEEVDHYLANSKTNPANDGTFHLLMSGRHVRTSHLIIQAIRNFEFAAANIYHAWQLACKSENSPTPVYKLGHIACGDSVGDAVEFKTFLLAHNRKFLAMEMESSGIAESAMARPIPIPLLILRGISDNAQDKQELDETSKGSWRAAAVRNATLFLTHLCKWPDFLALMRKSPDNTVSIHQAHLQDVIRFIKDNE